ncbi:HD domain-containing protein [Aurantimonas sp. A2-1-M11]|uniref:HD domain-containing protein n=1 Tax=Aurantimonas sp. A2-1-M11 TaxID=3113712 RepID=UPI002F926DBE
MSGDLAKTQRIRDSVHGLIVFDGQGEDAARDQTAWQLLNTPEMQRLRRVRQLGVSELTFPGATHTRFAHSVGVFDTARRLIEVLKAKLPDDEWRHDRADVVVFAALLHDIGHGPFSHAFEEAQKARGEEKNHEDWSAEIILQEDGKIRRILERFRPGMAQDIADLLRADVPQDAYHAVVSSSFDADRLDYLRRDRLMTGSGAGAIDFEWLLDNLRVAAIQIGADDDDIFDAAQKTFCLDRKAFQAAESFLLARYHLFEQVYLHKTTRGFEQAVGQLLGWIAAAARGGDLGRLGLDQFDPLASFFADGGGTLENYLALDDSIVWASAARVAKGPDANAKRLARRLLDREPFKVLDIQGTYPRRPNEDLDAAEARWQAEIQRIDEMFADQIGITVLKDVASISIYSEIGSDQTKAQKRLMILVNEAPHEITQLSDTIRALQAKRTLVRYFFSSDGERQRALGGQP